MKITEERIESLGFKYTTVSANGGSQGFTREIDGKFYMIKYHGNNFLYRNNNDPRFNQIEIYNLHVPTLSFVELDVFNTTRLGILKERLKRLKLL